MDSETDASASLALGTLEDKIRQAAEVLATLRRERDAALAELEKAREANTTATKEASKIQQELETLRTERTQVRVRIEKLLGQMEALSGS